ncbi:MAG: hypothetical protein CMB44_00275 [Euryarchaeota archaeon]|nr:hypothetical protein [Euryarchaeota archaeon]
MSSSSPDANEVPRGLSARLSNISQERLVEEVISAWDEVNATERVIASLRQKVSSLEMELSEREESAASRVTEVELQEALRVSESRVSQLQRSLENERARRKALEDSGGEARLAELRDENARLIKSEEELMVMVLEMEGRIDRLISAIKGDSA